MPDFFISRNRTDQDWAVWIAWQLEAAGYETVLQDWDFRPGSNFVVEMQYAAEAAERTIAVLSQAFLASEYTASEWAAAFAGDPAGTKRKVIPVRVRPCKPSGLLGQIARIDLVGLDETAAREALLTGVTQGRSKPATAPPFPGKVRGPKPAFPGYQQRATPLADGSRRSASQRLDANAAAARIDQQGWGVRPDRGRGGWTGDVWLGAVFVPENQGVPYVDELDLGRPELGEQILGLALFGRSAVFRSTRRTVPTEQTDHLIFEQPDDRDGRSVAALAVHTDGTLVYRTVVERRTSTSGYSLADAHIIDQDAVHRSMAAFAAFADGFYKQRKREPGTLYLGVSLSDIDRKHFGRLPKHDLQSFTIGDPRIEDPLRIPATPLRISSAQRANPEAVASTVVEHVARAFRLAGAYYTS